MTLARGRYSTARVQHVVSGPAPEQDRMRRALIWLGDQGAHYSPPGALAPRAEKAAVELALMVAVLLRGGASPEDPVLVRLIDLVQAIGDRQDIRSRPIAGTADALLHAIIYAVLERSGRPAEEHRTAVVHAVAAGIFDSVERLPYHMMEEDLFLRWAGVATGLPDLPELAARSMLSRRLNAMALSERATYHLTHDIMFLAALDPAAQLPTSAPDLQNVNRVLADLIVSFSAESHWDLLGELLLSWDCLTLPRDTLYRRGWHLLLSQQDADGSFPGPPIPGPPNGDHTDPLDRASRFQHRHHTTLVAVLALNGRARRPPVDSRPDPQPPTMRTVRIPTTADNAASAVRIDALWLEGLLERDGATDPSVACGVLVGTWLCAAVDAHAKARMPAVARRVADVLRTHTRWETVPPALTLTAYALLRRYELGVPGLSDFVELTGQVLADHPPGAADGDLMLVEKRVLLYRLGLASPPRRLAVGRTRETIDRLGLRPAPDALATAILAAESTAGHGTVRVLDEPSAAELDRYAAHRFRSGDLTGGCAVARAAHHLTPVPQDRADEFIDWILLHQLPDGGYGRRRGIGDGLRGTDIDLQLHLPTTLACLWTLVELSGDFRLYLSIDATPMSRASSAKGKS